MNVELGTEAAQFPEKEYINRNFVAGYTGENKTERERGGLGSGSDQRT
jgi:hypothetical protein